jgi:hypothetical protein
MNSFSLKILDNGLPCCNSYNEKESSECTYYAELDE